MVYINGDLYVVLPAKDLPPGQAELHAMLQNGQDYQIVDLVIALGLSSQLPILSRLRGLQRRGAIQPLELVKCDCGLESGCQICNGFGVYYRLKVSR